MDQRPVSSERLASSVIAVPPIARRDDFSLDWPENGRLIRHLEAGGIRSILYGGNANLYNVGSSQYGELLEMTVELSGDETLVMPAAGPDFGKLMEQAAILRTFSFPTVMVLPAAGASTPDGVATGIRRFAESVERPVVLYLKEERYLTVGLVRTLVEEGLVSWIKYAVVRADPSSDRYLTEITAHVPPSMIVSGMGEQPAPVHLTRFGLIGFTSGCVCVAPRLSMRLLVSLQRQAAEVAEQIRRLFEPLEALRNTIGPIQVLHDAVALAGVSDTGPLLPLLSNLDDRQRDRVGREARTLLETERSWKPRPDGS